MTKLNSVQYDDPLMQDFPRWPANARIVHVGARSGALGSWFLRSGLGNYLGVVADEPTRREIIQSHSAVSRHIAVSGSKRIVRQNNAEVLVLNGRSVFALLRFRNVRHARHVGCELRWSLSCLIGMLAGIWQWLLRRFRRPRIIPVCDGRVRLMVFEVRRPQPHAGARRYIPLALGVEGFLVRLKGEGVRHAVLRWFEALPNLPAGEDLDLLIDDASLEVVHRILDEGPGVQPMDLYTVTGLPGSDFRGMPYFPPFLAEQLLERAVNHNGLCSVPAPREHFLSLAYHALYHKGADSGLKQRDDRSIKRKREPADHDYASVLERLASQLRIELNVDLDSLDKYLDTEGWRPPHDMLVRLARHNAWIRARLQQPQAHSDDRLAVFLLREAAMERGGVERACELLTNAGFRVLAVRRFEPTAALKIARTIRGGNWGRGPWPVSGGPPVAAIVVYDASPIAPSRRGRRRYPFLANARLLAKEQIRDAFNEGFPPEQHCNVIHSSDNGREASDYLRVIGSDFAAQVLESLAALSNGLGDLEALGQPSSLGTSKRVAA